MTRRCKDWLQTYLEYHGHSEAPERMRYWCGVSAISGALRRQVWIDQFYFQWYPNFYVVLVAPPGVVSKTTTASVAMRLLRKVPGIKFGPDVVTWESLSVKFSEAREAFEYNGEFHMMSALTLESGEFGNLLDPQNRAMVDFYVTLWDGKQGNFEKSTKTSGEETIVNPWINIVACTTPAWIAGSFPEYMIGGGFTSRCVFVYAEEKAQLIANPGRVVPKSAIGLEEDLVHDLVKMSQMIGEMKMSEAAYDWTDAWYKRHHAAPPAHLNDDRFGGYLARKQTHMYKLAMVIAASRSDRLVLEPEHFIEAYDRITNLEHDMVKVFARIGRSEEAANTERLLVFIRKNGPIHYESAYAYVHQHFPRLKNFEDILAGLIRAGLISMGQAQDGKVYLAAPPPKIRVN